MLQSLGCGDGKRRPYGAGGRGEGFAQAWLAQSNWLRPCLISRHRCGYIPPLDPPVDGGRVNAQACLRRSNWLRPCLISRPRCVDISRLEIDESDIGGPLITSSMISKLEL